ncbi:MAG: hypothetical protein P4L33_08370 [Capsulimonadaceae bacterium]|nr:hypothetical protein [Capsulimonadaceae bacterium]
MARPASVIPDDKGGFRDEGDVIANPFAGLLGGLLVCKRALTDHEIADIAVLTL